MRASRPAGARDAQEAGDVNSLAAAAAKAAEAANEPSSGRGEGGARHMPQLRPRASPLAAADAERVSPRRAAVARSICVAIVYKRMWVRPLMCCSHHLNALISNTQHARIDRAMN